MFHSATFCLEGYRGSLAHHTAEGVRGRVGLTLAAPVSAVRPVQLLAHKPPSTTITPQEGVTPR